MVNLFSVITDHRALLSIMRENRANKSSYDSCLTCWGDLILPSDFSIDHLPGTKIGLVDYIFRENLSKKLSISPLMMSIL